MSRSIELEIKIDDGAGRGTTTGLVYAGAADTPGQRVNAALILAHGAGAGQRHPFIVAFADALSRRGIDVVTFNFLYMEQRRRFPDRAPLLEACYRSVIDVVCRSVPSAERFLVIGGKSMGGRIATQVAASDDRPRIDALVLLGYPLHPPGKPHQRRDAHLSRIGKPMLIVQGTRDAFGTPVELAPALATLPDATVHVVEGGDHSFKLSRRDPAAQAAVYDDAQRTIAEWIDALSGTAARTPSRSA